MKNRWHEEAAASCRDELDLRVYSSRLLGQDPELVLHGGGNTSVKLTALNLFGEPQELLYVKGSGGDLATIGREGFTALHLAPLARLAQLEQLSDPDMLNSMLCLRTDAAAPPPSVEAILHAVLPARYVDHTHADAVVTVTNTPDGEARVRSIYGDRVVVVPYVKPGFALARRAAEIYAREAGPATVGMVLLQHGIFSWGESARESYERMVDLVALAEQHLQERGAWQLPAASQETPAAFDRVAVATLRRELATVAGFPLVVRSERSARVFRFLRRPDLATLTQQGPATPDHVIRTKRRPLLGRDVAAYAEEYRAEFARLAAQSDQSDQAAEPITMLDPAPRVVLDPEFGLLAVGRSAKDAGVVADIYHHTMDIEERAARLGGWCALPERDLFEVEYWDLEQAKLRRAGAPLPMAGEVALVTGAASGIGRATALELLARGAAVVGFDRDPAVAELANSPAFLPVVGDVTVAADLARGLDATVAAFGGLDVLVLNAGAFLRGGALCELPDDALRRSLALHTEANLAWMREAHPLLARAPGGGRVVVVASKNVPAPGPGAGAYSAAKAALTQLARVAALEWGADAIRVNVVHPHAVFDTAVWTDEVLASRAAAYGLTVEQYKSNNLLRVEVTSRDVAAAVVELVGTRFRCTTGAQVPVDGGNERVI